MAMPMTPRTIHYPLGLVVDTGGAASAVGKLTSHRPDAWITGDTKRSQLKHGQVLVEVGLSEKIPPSW